MESKLFLSSLILATTLCGFCLIAESWKGELSEEFDEREEEQEFDNNNETEPIGESRSGALASEPATIPDWMMLLFSPHATTKRGHFSGIGTRLTDNLFMADFQTILRTEMPPHNCETGYWSQISKVVDRDLRTIDVSRPPERDREFQSNELWFFSNPRIRLYRLQHLETHPVDFTISIPYAFPIRGKRDAPVPQIPSSRVFKLPHPTKLQTDPSIHDNCVLHTYLPVPNSKPTKYKWERIPVTYSSHHADLKEHEFHYDGKGDRAFTLDNNGSPIFCRDTFSFIATLCHVKCASGIIRALSIAENADLIQKFINKFVSYLPMQNFPHK